MEFKNKGRLGDARDTLYFNDFTEDLFSWDNDLENDTERFLKLNSSSRFFVGLETLEMDNRIRRLLGRYADFDFKLEILEKKDSDGRVTERAQIVRFYRDEQSEEGVITKDNIKVSRGEENIFIWCFFLAVVELAMDPEIEAYRWVKYIYIDDPISSLDEGNAIAVAHHLAQLLVTSASSPKTVVSSHHVLFFNVLCNEFKNKAYKYFMMKATTPPAFVLQDTTSKPFLHHLATLVELNVAQETGTLNTYHFNILRRVMEQSACFFGLGDWQNCIRVEEDDPDKMLYKRVIDLMNHGDYSLYEPREMMDENKRLFSKVFRQFITNHPFNPELFPAAVPEKVALS
jgi:hypothetical protein